MDGSLTFSSAKRNTFLFFSHHFLHVYYLVYAEASQRLALLFWNRNWICMKYAHTKLHLTLGGGNTWQSPLPEMIVLRKTLDDDNVDEVFFCAEMGCQKKSKRSSFRCTGFSHFLTIYTDHSVLRRLWQNPQLRFGGFSERHEVNPCKTPMTLYYTF